MKHGKTMQEIAATILWQAGGAKDIIINDAAITMRDDGCALIPEGDAGIPAAYTPTATFNRQLAEKIGVPVAYYQRMLAEDKPLLARNVNTWLARNEKRRYVRLIGGENPVARAFLGEKFQPRDNAQLAEHILPKLQAEGLRIESAEITDDNLFIQAVSSEVKGEIAVGDEVYNGVIIRNSETGCGSTSVAQLVWRKACSNGLILPKVVRSVHVGSGRAGDIGVQYVRNDTIAAETKGYWMRVRDAVDYILSPEGFSGALKGIRESSQKSIGNVVEAVAGVVQQYRLTKPEGESVLNHLASGKDMSLWGLANAVTATANTSEKYERAIYLEEAGGEIVFGRN